LDVLLIFWEGVLVIGEESTRIYKRA
jgi:hypothetical protein